MSPGHWKGRKFEDMSREELVASLVDVIGRWERADQQAAEVMGETIDEMQMLLHNYRANCLYTIEVMEDPACRDRMPRDARAYLIALKPDLLQTIEQINKVLSGTFWDPEKVRV